MKFIARLPVYLVFALATYIGLSQIRYRLLHPELTETQLFFHTLDALAWRQ